MRTLNAFLHDILLAALLAIVLGAASSAFLFLQSFSLIMVIGGPALIVAAFAAHHPRWSMKFSAFIAGVFFLSWGWRSFYEPSILRPVDGPLDVAMAVFGFGFLIVFYINSGRREERKIIRSSTQGT